VSKPFLKTILPAAYGYNEPIAALIDVHSHGVDSAWMSKRAAAGVFQTLDLRPERDYSYLHVIAMGASDRYGANRNGDAFLSKSGEIEIPEPKPGTPKIVKIAQGLVETHSTFETDAKVYRQHQNKDPQNNEGDVVKSAYHLPMDRVELIIKVPNVKWGDDLQKLASGDDIPLSMSTKVPFDVCTFCGNKAKSRAEYCDHAKNYLGTVIKSGHQVGVMNDWMKFFDISRVRVGADRIAKALLKAAAVSTTEAGQLMSGAELAEHMTLFPPADADDFGHRIPLLDKVAVLRKLSDIEKQIEATGMGASNSCEQLAFGVPPDMQDDDLRSLRMPHSHMSGLLGATSDAKICLSLHDFMKLLLGDRFQDVEHAVPEAESKLPGVFTRMLSDGGASAPVSLDDFNFGSELLPRAVRDVIGGLTPSHSLADDPVHRRVTLMVLRGEPGRQTRKTILVKGGSDGSLAESLAQAYALYKAAFCKRVGFENKMLTDLAVLQHYVI